MKRKKRHMKKLFKSISLTFGKKKRRRTRANKCVIDGGTLSLFRYIFISFDVFSVNLSTSQFANLASYY